MDENKTNMIPVPLPTEVPPPPNLDKIPLDILHSATVEMLIQQNEDLSSRLKVNIRRNSQLEQRILTQDKEIAELNRKRENVLAQIEIIKEKEKIWSTQKQDQQRQAESLRKESDLLELRYNELYATTRQKDKNRQAELVEKQKQIQSLQKKLDIMHRVRIRAKEKLRQLLIDMAQGLHKSHKHVRQSESSNRLLQRNFTDLRNEIIEKENFFREQLQNLKSASQKNLQSLDSKITSLTESNRFLREKKDELQADFDKMQLQLHEEKKNRIRLKKATEELNELKNERLRMKRTLENHKDEQDELRSAHSEEIQKLKAELKTLRTRVEKSDDSLSQSEKKSLSLSKDNRELSNQLAALQKLWMQAQQKLEKEELRSQTLEKINRQLSQQKKTEKIESSIAVAHPEPETEKAPNKEADPFQKKIQNVFASQYRTMGKSPEMDV